MKKYSFFEYSIPSPKRKAWAILSIVFLLTVFLSSGLKELRFDYDFEKFFPSDDPESIFFRAHRKKFESDNDFLLIAIERKKGVFNRNFLNQIDDLTEKIKKEVPYVTRVASITTVPEIKILPPEIVYSDPYIHPQGDLKSDSSRIYRSDELINEIGRAHV